VAGASAKLIVVLPDSTREKLPPAFIDIEKVVPVSTVCPSARPLPSIDRKSPAGTSEIFSEVASTYVGILLAI
jgi:hypothetical protein